MSAGCIGQVNLTHTVCTFFSKRFEVNKRLFSTRRTTMYMYYVVCKTYKVLGLNTYVFFKLGSVSLGVSSLHHPVHVLCSLRLSTCVYVRVYVGTRFTRQSDIVVPEHESSIFRSFIQPYMWFLHDGTGYSLCSLAHRELAWLILEPDTGLDHCPRILLSCFKARISEAKTTTICDNCPF